MRTSKALSNLEFSRLTEVYWLYEFFFVDIYFLKPEKVTNPGCYPEILGRWRFEGIGKNKSYCLVSANASEVAWDPWGVMSSLVHRLKPLS